MSLRDWKADFARSLERVFNHMEVYPAKMEELYPEASGPFPRWFMRQGHAQLAVELAQQEDPKLGMIRHASNPHARTAARAAYARLLREHHPLILKLEMFRSEMASFLEAAELSSREFQSAITEETVPVIFGRPPIHNFIA
eukprot:TRINITY_DN59201_c0_g1_i1.p1 TRINITY_DN59201_c0_g1~~TRINITY_DN59201_c0_g1_i1.p1  ORF type:complete len:159 (-),score=23.47 TRINITY_DN59201_c0_g1_i1:222-644(-)